MNQEVAVKANISEGKEGVTVTLPVIIESVNYHDSDVQVKVVFTVKQDAKVIICKRAFFAY